MSLESTKVIVPKIRVQKHKFIRYQSNRFKRLSPSWRKPRGIDSAVRRKLKGYPEMPNVGYRSEKITRDVHPNGYYVARVFSMAELEALEPVKDSYCAVIAEAVGGKKRIMMLQRADELEIVVQNAAKSRIITEEVDHDEEDDRVAVSSKDAVAAAHDLD